MSIKDIDIIGSREVCKICGITNQYLQFLVLTKKIPAKKVSNCWVFLRSEILEFQKKRQIKAKTDKRVKLKK